MKIPLHIAEKLNELKSGRSIPASKAKHPVIEQLIDEEIIFASGKIKKTIRLVRLDSFNTFLKSQYNISDLTAYIQTLQNPDSLRADLVQTAGDSKLKNKRTFKGFLINAYIPIKATLNQKDILIKPVEGKFEFIYDFGNFIPDTKFTIVGLENPENFRYVNLQRHLFSNIHPLFVCRYPQNQSKDLMKWLQNIPNNYLHFGDFDFAGIGIYLNEYKKHLKDKSKLFIPDNIENAIKKGTRERYNKQKINFEIEQIQEQEILELINTINKYKKGLDQEYFIKTTPAHIPL